MVCTSAKEVIGGVARVFKRAEWILELGAVGVSVKFKNNSACREEVGKTTKDRVSARRALGVVPFLESEGETFRTKECYFLFCEEASNLLSILR